MTSDEDFILVPNIIPTTRIIEPIAIKRGVAKQLLAAKGDSQSIYALSLQHKLSLQAAEYISHLELVEIERSSKYIGAL
ncbi:hypothetical protein PMI22_03419 [Pseudomonas sp. GM21]|nr:hypothetical protein PMI22_03419 [Pseudomonas sp. GM21]